MTDTIIATRYPGDDGQPIRTFPEQLEKDVGNILGRNIEYFQAFDKDHPGDWVVLDKSALVLELLEYITEKYENNSNR